MEEKHLRTYSSSRSKTECTCTFLVSLCTNFFKQQQQQRKWWHSWFCCYQFHKHPISNVVLFHQQNEFILYLYSSFGVFIDRKNLCQHINYVFVVFREKSTWNIRMAMWRLFLIQFSHKTHTVMHIVHIRLSSSYDLNASGNSTNIS